MNEIKKATGYSFSSEDVDKMVKQKEKFQKHPVNYAMHKARLIKVIFFKPVLCSCSGSMWYHTDPADVPFFVNFMK